MSSIFTRADSIREYLTGAASDGGVQIDPNASIGNFRSSSEAQSLGIQIMSPIEGVKIQKASGANPIGVGYLISPTPYSLQWQPQNAVVPGMPVNFAPGATQNLIIEGPDPAQFLRVSGTPPFSVGASLIRLDPVLGNVFGFDIVPNAKAVSGVSQYRATILRNESQGSIFSFARWIKELGTACTSNINQLGATGSGNIQTSYTFSNWPLTGWCQIQQAGGAIREVVYYTGRTLTTLTVPAAGRGLLGTSAGAGASTDTIRSVPGIAIGFDPAGVQSFGSAITTIANENTAPAGVTWNLFTTRTSGLAIASMLNGKQIGFWLWRQIPAGAIFSPNLYNNIGTFFRGY